MSLYCNITRNFNYLCGVLNIKNFHTSYNEYSSSILVEQDMFKKWKQQGGLGGKDIRGNSHNTGAQYFEAGFINDELSTQMFDKLTSLFPLVFLSEKRMNINSDNEFYFAVFDIKDFV